MWCIALAAWLSVVAANSRSPHIVLIVADDLGWDDVGFHGSNEVQTPNIDALAAAGLVLQHHHVAPVCTPSRASLMTGKYAIHTGMQHKVIYGMEPRGLPLSERILPQYLKDLGYSTHLVGKWHLGSYKKAYLPCQRGFDTHTGFITGKIDMYDHTNMETGTWGFDFRRDPEIISHDLFGKYATDIYTEEAVKLIKYHNRTQPLFLVVAHSAVHSGNPYEPLRAPEDVVAKFSHIQDRQRQKFAGMLWKLDESVGKVMEALQESGLLSDSIVLFTSDNGGPAAGFNRNAASNYPLRGVKNTLWEGGVRAAAALFSPLLQKPSRLAPQRLHISDWLPTLYGAAGGDTSILKGIDGFNSWEALSKDLKTERTSVVHNIDDIFGSAAITINQWKLLKGTTYNGTWDGWYETSKRKGEYQIDATLQSRAAKAIRSLGLMPDKDKVFKMRAAASINCSQSTTAPIACNPLVAPCLFNIDDDPCERVNMAEKEPEILQKMLIKLKEINATAVPPNNRNLDLRGDPKYWGRVFVNFGDFVSENPSIIDL
ncbi:hypothetical protein ACJJTC_000120 [Scirpophaga incertulas]